jgi:hypothetical protein
MHQAAKLHFERAVDAFVRWHAVRELGSLADQTSLPWPDGFPRRGGHSDPESKAPN